MKMTFKLPDGVQVPDGKQPGDTFQAMGTFLLQKGGKAEFCEIDGEQIDGATKSSDYSPDDDAPDDATQPMSVQDRLMGASAGGQ